MSIYIYIYSSLVYECLFPNAAIYLFQLHCSIYILAQIYNQFCFFLFCNNWRFLSFRSCRIHRLLLFICIKMDLALINLLKLICHKTQTNKLSFLLLLHGSGLLVWDLDCLPFKMSIKLFFFPFLFSGYFCSVDVLTVLFLVAFSVHFQIVCFYTVYLRGAYHKFPDFFRRGTFIVSTHMKLKSPSK